MLMPSSNALSSSALYLCLCLLLSPSSLTLFPRISLNLSLSPPTHTPGSQLSRDIQKEHLWTVRNASILRIPCRIQGAWTVS